MLTFLINVSITWLILFVIYKSLLAKEKHFRLNRLYLLSSIVLGLILPLLSFVSLEELSSLPIITNEINQTYQEQLLAISEYSNTVQRSTPVAATSSNIPVSLILQLIYVLGLLIAFFRMMKSALKLGNLFRQGKITQYATHAEIDVKEKILPFSFLQYVFIGNEAYADDERANILKHELYHVNAYHSIDILIMETLKVIFWWHPLVYQYKQALVQNHEYAADGYVLTNSSRKQYCAMLMKKTFPNVNLGLTNPFFQNYVNKRITMMYQSNSNKYGLLKYSVGIFAVVFIAAILAKPLEAQKVEDLIVNSTPDIEKAENDHIPIVSSSELTPVNDEANVTDKKEESEIKVAAENKITSDCKKNKYGIYYHLSVGARLPSCPSGVDGREHALPILSAFARENFKWPVEAIEAGYYNRVHFDFAVDEKGKMGEVLYEHEEPYPYGVEEEGRRIIELMRDEFNFLPGECNGQPVKTRLFFTLTLKVPEDKKHLIKVTNSSNITPNQQASIFAVSNSGQMSLNYSSNMNVTASFEVSDPDGNVIYKEAIENLYGFYYRNFQLPKNMNGTYMFRVTQDGLIKETKMAVTVFN